MIRTKIIPGGWYGDALTNGGYGWTIPHTKVVATDLGDLPYPLNDEPLWLVLTDTPERRYAAQSHFNPWGYEWKSGQGWRTTTAPCGVWPVIYDTQGILHISRCQEGVGSQGWRYVNPDGWLVTGDATVWVRHGLNERTDLSLAQDGSTEVGQDNQGRGVGVWAGGRLKILTLGACFNVRAKYDPHTDIVVVSCYNVASDGIEGRIFWMSWEDLQTIDVHPPPPPAHTMLKPEVTVDTFNFGPNNHLADGTYLIFHDRINTEGAIVAVWVEKGSMRMSIRYPKVGEGSTGAERRVR